MRLLQLQWGFPVGGGSRYVQILDRMAREHGLDSHVLCVIAPHWPTDEAGLAGIAHTRIAIRGRADVSWLGRVADEVSARRPDLLLTHGFNGHFVAWQVLRRLRADIPVVCSYHGPYHATGPVTQATGFVYERFTEQFFRRKARAVVTVAEHARQRLIRHGVPSGKITVIHNAIEDRTAEPLAPQRDEWRRRWNVRDDEMLIGAVGRLDPIKGYDDLLHAFDRVAARQAAARLVIVGEGPDRARLEGRIALSPFASRVRLAGLVSNAAEALPAFDVYVLPSHSECHSMALLEAMRAGLPVVATAVGGNLETIVNGAEGLLVPARDPAALAAALELLVDQPAQARSFGVRARERFLREFSLSASMRRTADWLRQCAPGAA